MHCFAEALGERAYVPGLGDISYDLGYGGAYYAILPSSNFGMNFQTTLVDTLRDAAVRITDHLRVVRPIKHPGVDDLSFLYGTILTDGSDAGQPLKFSANLCVFAEGQIGRSPAGSGICARLAVDQAKGLTSINDAFSFAGLSGESFEGKIISAEAAGVRIRVSGNAFYSGRSQLLVEEADSLGNGFNTSATMTDVASEIFEELTEGKHRV